jgi:hypothetical protein
MTMLARCSTGIVLFGAVTCAFAAGPAPTPRKASTIQNSPFVWPNTNYNEMVQAGVILARDVAMVENGAGMPWEVQVSNKQRCAAEQITLSPAAITLKVGETFRIEQLIVQSSAFGTYYYDAASTKKWKYESAVAVIDRPSMTLRAVSSGETELQFPSLCKSRGMASPTPVVTIKVVVTEP